MEPITGTDRKENFEDVARRTVVYSVDISTSSNHFSLSCRPNWVWSLVI